MKLFKLTNTTSINKDSVIAADKFENFARVRVYSELKEKGWPIDQSKVDVDVIGESTTITKPCILVIGTEFKEPEPESTNEPVVE